MNLDEAIQIVLKDFPTIKEDIKTNPKALVGSFLAHLRIAQHKLLHRQNRLTALHGFVIEAHRPPVALRCGIQLGVVAQQATNRAMAGRRVLVDAAVDLNQ